MTDILSKKILLTGASGFVGRHVYETLLKRGICSKNILRPGSKDADLRLRENALKVTKEIDIIIHLAGNVGGIGYNRKYPGTLFYDNLMMGVNLIEAAKKNSVEKFLCIGTICSYPKFTPVPFQEEDLWNGYPEGTNAPYGIAKKVLLTMLKAYKQEFGMNGVYLLPVNMYGPQDNFDPKSSHVIPAIIRKIAEAKENNQDSITAWGDGSPTREFFYVKDAAEAIVSAAEKYNDIEPVNIGSGNEISIKQLVETIVKEMGFQGEIKWDTTRPNGQPRRCLDVSRAKKYFDFEAKTDFLTGLRETIKYYYDKIA
ncbi:NAD-dependent epimerase/dehydratase family protein [Candidatus Dojkabacteria bacterium]|nr:NAD-dependent epimerase/dehydratase family protein [Candidatus Dojkabacteria bacterium]